MWQRPSRLLIALTLAGFASALGCQSIADIPEVRFSETCKQYCDAIFEVCPTALGQYEEPRDCLESCDLIDQNANGSTNSFGNTLQCRLTALQDAATSQGSTSDRLQYCSQAGPGGGDRCTVATGATDCEGYCALFDLACQGDTENPFMGAIPNDSTGTQSECVEKCRGIPASPDPGYTWQTGKTSGDTLGCRLYYVTKAVAEPEANCTFAGIRPAGPCQDAGLEPSCEKFCLALTTACVDKLEVYESQEQCVAVCDVITPGSKVSIDAVDTVGCRNAHAFNALLVSPADHCPHSGPLGAQVCGASGNCEALCALAEQACQAEFTDEFEDQADCIDQCTTLEGATLGTYSVQEAKKGGNTVQCRGLAVSRVLALPESERDAEACAPVFGGSPCSG